MVRSPADRTFQLRYADVSAAPAGLLEALLPGPLTLVLPARRPLPGCADTVAVK